MATIYIPSKGRADHCLTAKALGDVDFKIVVEPQDAADYHKHFEWSHLLLLPFDDKGIAAARNFIKGYSIDRQEAYHWQIDDNIRSFAKREAGKNVVVNPRVCLQLAETYVGRFDNIGIAGLKHQAFAFAAKDEISINQQIYTCFIVNNRLKDLWWRSGCVEDTDYSMQVLSSGYCTLLFNRLVMNKVTTMTMKGGNTEISYAGTGRMVRSMGLLRRWPGAFKLKIGKDGVARIAPSQVWRKFKQRPRVIPHHDLDGLQGDQRCHKLRI